MTAKIVPHDSNMDHLVNDRAEHRLWGPSSYVPGQGNRRMVTKGKTSRAISGKRILSATSAPLHPGGTPSYWRVA